MAAGRRLPRSRHHDGGRGRRAPREVGGRAAAAGVGAEKALARNLDGIDLSVVLPAKGEAANLASLLPSLRAQLEALGVSFEILVVTSGADADVEASASAVGGHVLLQELPGHGGALKRGFGEARGEWVLTMDADESHCPAFIADMSSG